MTRDFLFDQLATTQRYFYPQQSFSVSEKTYGGYLMGNLKGDGWRGNVGVRWVQTEQTSDANNPNPAGAIENVFGNYDPISVDHDYDDDHRRTDHRGGGMRRRRLRAGLLACVAAAVALASGCGSPAEEVGERPVDRVLIVSLPGLDWARVRAAAWL